MRYAFAILIIIHSLIHLMGFAKAFYLTDIQQQVIGISRPIGSIWLITFILFIITSIQYLTNKKWFYIALIAVFVSQILIIMSWKEAKFGTLINSIILVVSISTFANSKFNEMVDREVNNLLNQVTLLNPQAIATHKIDSLPEIVQKWLYNSKVIGQEQVFTVRLKQKGQMRMKPNSKWMPFEATQYFNIENPSFVWNTKVDAMPLISLVGRDKLVDGKGDMLIKLASLIPVVNETSNNKLDQGAMLRYLAEICWFPSVALHNFISWQPIDESSAKATFTYNNQFVSGVFTFRSNGDFKSFEAARYYGGNKDATLENWFVEALTTKEVNSVRIPIKSKVTWKLKDGDFNWLTVEIIDIEYNTVQQFK